MENAVLNIFEKIDAPVDPENIERCHRLKTVDNGQSDKVMEKFSKHKDMARVLVSPSTSLFINPSLCSYHKHLLSKCKLLWSSKLIFSFWALNGSLRIKSADDAVKSVTHKDYLKVLFPGKAILIDRE